MGVDEIFKDELEEEKREEEHNYNNPAVAACEAELGPLILPARAENPLLEQREECLLEGGEKYTGEWLRGTQTRCGFGRQIFIDGTIYEGMWENGKAHGKGRVIHADGEYYEGDFREDKAHGFGVYSYLDGSRYEGSWIDDK